MILRSPAPRHTPAWQRELARAVNRPQELLRLLELELPENAVARLAQREFALRVPRGFVARMRKGDPADPLLRQVLPLDAEMQPAPGYSADPLREGDTMPVPGLLHKYRGRVLLTVTGACAVHCRYCFRRHFPYGEANPGAEQWHAALTYLHGNPDIHEVILSGGDPLSLTDDRLAALVERLDAVPHLRRLRIHTRLPVVLPERIDARLLDWLGGTRLTPVVVIHANHPREIDTDVARACRRLAETGATLLNQSVLLRGVNDDARVLAMLSETLLRAGVLPYYLHQLDPVQGAAHFAVPDAEAHRLWGFLRDALPGYLVPRLVREIPGEAAKTLLSPGITN